MDKKLFGELIASVREAGRIARGKAKAKQVHVYPDKRVRQIRREFRPSQIIKVRQRHHMSQAEFAGCAGATIAAGAKEQDGCIVLLLAVARGLEINFRHVRTRACVFMPEHVQHLDDEKGD